MEKDEGGIASCIGSLAGNQFYAELLLGLDHGTAANRNTHTHHTLCILYIMAFFAYHNIGERYFPCGDAGSRTMWPCRERVLTWPQMVEGNSRETRSTAYLLRLWTVYSDRRSESYTRDSGVSKTYTDQGNTCGDTKLLFPFEDHWGDISLWMSLWATEIKTLTYFWMRKRKPQGTRKLHYSG